MKFTIYDALGQLQMLWWANLITCREKQDAEFMLLLGDV